MSIILDAEACGTLIDDRVQKRPDALLKVKASVLRARAQRDEARAALALAA